ncbi:hypothetical protein ACHAXH_004297 [Discostella pseudostelligera]
MIPSISILPSSAKEAAMETTEEMMKAFQSLYSQVNCSDMSLSLPTPDCSHLTGGEGRNDDDGEGGVKLNWRVDPFMSMSDLSLVVFDGRADSGTKGSSGGIAYHVHTLTLAYGGRKSGFVADQIKMQQKNPSSNNNSTGRGSSNRRGSTTSSISMHRQGSTNSNESNNSNASYKVDIFLPPLAARHMPLFLDYVYGSSLKLTTANAPPLRYLSNKFDCRDLHKEISSKFIPQDLEIGTAPQYCMMADELKDFELRDKSIRIMAERFDKINVNALKWMNPSIMRSLLQYERLECGSSDKLSEIVAQYLRLRDDDTLADGNGDERRQNKQNIAPLTDEDFYWLTHCQHMPTISAKEALFYYNYGATRYPQIMNENGVGSFQSRCLAACSSSLAMDALISHLESDTEDLTPSLDMYETLEPQMKIQLLESTVVGAKKLMIEKEKRHSEQNDRCRDMRQSDEIMYTNNRLASSSNTNNSNAKVMKVVVLGAGVAPANGLYLCKNTRIQRKTANDGSSSSDHQQRHVQHPDNGNILVYEKEAIWNKEQVTFVLYPVASGQYYTQYKLGVRSHNHTTVKVLYNSPTIVGSTSRSSDGSGSIPEQAWEVEEDVVEGLHPPPQFVGRVIA